MELGESRTAALRELVKRYLVCWDVCPHLLVVDKRNDKVGFELELCGSHVPKSINANPAARDAAGVPGAIRDCGVHLAGREPCFDV